MRKLLGRTDVYGSGCRFPGAPAVRVTVVPALTYSRPYQQSIGSAADGSSMVSSPRRISDSETKYVPKWL